MTTSRREFLDRLAVSGLAVSALPLSLDAMSAAGAPAAAQKSSWDTTWTRRLNARVNALFDVPEVESGFGVWRASFWTAQYEAALGIPAKETATALVLRHNAIILAMQQGFWDKYGTGKSHRVMHPLTGAPTDRNPALMGASDGIPDPFNMFTLDKFIAGGGICLACDLALRFDVVPVIQKADGVTAERAHEIATGLLVPGAIPQPSGVFAVLHAQQAGAHYIRAS